MKKLSLLALISICLCCNSNETKSLELKVSNLETELLLKKSIIDSQNIIIASKEPKILDGQYIGEIINDDSKWKFMWIFGGNRRYNLYKSGGRYSDEGLGIGYESVSTFYIKDNDLYICPDFIWAGEKPLSYNECQKEAKSPSFKITKIDTIYDGHTTSQVINLSSYHTSHKYEIKKTIYDTIKREITRSEDELSIGEWLQKHRLQKHK